MPTSHLSLADAAMVNRIFKRAECPPPPVNAAVVLDGSSVAGEGVGTRSAELELLQFTASWARECRASAKLLRSQGDISGAMGFEAEARDCEAYLRAYADGLLSNGSLFLQSSLKRSS